MSALRDEFLSEEDLDLRNLSDEELDAYWNMWLEQAQATNDLDAHLYAHGVFTMPLAQDSNTNSAVCPLHRSANRGASNGSALIVPPVP